MIVEFFSFQIKHVDGILGEYSIGKFILQNGHIVQKYYFSYDHNNNRNKDIVVNMRDLLNQKLLFPKDIGVFSTTYLSLFIHILRCSR